MKRLLIAAALLCSLTCASAQNKGDMSLSFAATADLGKTKQSLKSGNQTIEADALYNPTVGAGMEFGYFPLNKLKLGLAFVYAGQTQKFYGTSGNILKNKTNTFGFAPEISYYCRLNDRFHYTPGISAGMAFITYSNAVNESTNVKTDYKSLNGSVSPLAFEYRINDRFACGASFGSVNYVYQWSKDGDTKTTMKTFQISADSEVQFTIYF